MTKYHITAKGEPGVCTAQEGNCPLGGSEDHYSDKDDAWRASMEKLKNEYGAFLTFKKEAPVENMPTLYDQEKEVIKRAEAVFQEVFHRRGGGITGAQEGLTGSARVYEKAARLTTQSWEDDDSLLERYNTFWGINTDLSARLEESSVVNSGMARHITEHLKAHGVRDPDKLAKLHYLSQPLGKGALLGSKEKWLRQQARMIEVWGVDEAEKFMRAARDENLLRSPRLLDEVGAFDRKRWKYLGGLHKLPLEYLRDRVR